MSSDQLKIGYLAILQDLMYTGIPNNGEVACAFIYYGDQ